mmetsp:Transcript_18727/g.39404  ORF Transcript_18727/g.39404 Transcript_18727/m.39404 type:complete len:138 (+) Transcript_18727:543-956(+)
MNPRLILVCLVQLVATIDHTGEVVRDSLFVTSNMHPHLSHNMGGFLWVIAVLNHLYSAFGLEHTNYQDIRQMERKPAACHFCYQCRACRRAGLAAVIYSPSSMGSQATHIYIDKFDNVPQNQTVDAMDSNNEVALVP